MVSPKVNSPGDHAEGRRQVRGRGVIMPPAGKSDSAGDRGLGGIHGGVIVVVGGASKCGW